MLFTFDTDTNTAGQGVGVDFPCTAANLFDSRTLSLIGTPNTCRWPSRAQLRVAYAVSSSIAGGEAIQLLGGAVSRAAVTTAVMPAQVVTIAPRRATPQLMSATMTNDGSGIVLQFDSASSGTIGGVAGAVGCAAILENANLGAGALCWWSSPTVLVARFGVGVSIVATSVPVSSCPSGVLPNDIIVLRSGVVGAVTGAINTASRTCVNVRYPVSPLPPRLSLQSQGEVDSCDPLVLDGSGTTDVSGRPLTFAWSVSDASGAAVGDSLRSVVTANALPTLTIAHVDLTPDATYSFNMSVTTFLGARAWTTWRVYIHSQPKPRLALDGGILRQTTSSLPVTLSAVAAVPNPSCAGDSTDKLLLFDWTLVSVARDPSIANTSYVSALQPSTLNGLVARYPASITLPVGAMQVGFQYVVRVNVTMSIDPSKQNSLPVTIRVVSGGVRAVIMGGSRVISQQSALLLDGSASLDFDLIAWDPFVYTWDCSYTGQASGGACPTSAGVLLSASVPFNQAAMSISAGVLAAGMYTFTLTVSKGSVGGTIPLHFRQGSTSVTITVLAGFAPSISIATSSAGMKVNPGSRVVLDATVTDDHGFPVTSMQWSAPLLSGSAFTSLLLTPDVTARSLVLQPKSAGYYTFSLSAWNTIGDEGRADVVVAVNGPPVNGYVDVSPSAGVELDTMFRVCSPGWVDDVQV